MFLTDSYNRPVTNIRISLTSKCNLGCRYCHREGEVSPKEEISFEDIAEILKTAAKFNMKSVKFTGGEPTLRKDIIEIVKAVPTSMESSMTTNGTLLSGMAYDLKDAGLSRVNVSLDSLKPEKYRKITGKDYLQRVIEGIDTSIEAGLTPVKLNVVILRDCNDDEIEDFISFVKNKNDIILQFIEYMDLKSKDNDNEMDSIEKELKKRSKIIYTRRMHHRKKYCIDGAEIEVVRPMHNNEFCAFCNRLRVTSDGELKPCLLRHDNHIDIKGKRGVELEELFKLAVGRREPFFR
ncbi:cyclic pyranopterin phosphate synthase [Methanomicrobium sp. W14]|uniref:GTP 3',8-cyclase MoaA n=1 Tax=Methanomicrobium sp. W14 TaxID=2817839 RepID=UPI001AEAD30B|nr:GTP 3',8-cyclase MoaA [Methanomicrobium sp. W14]MBP2132553.1 cyclic pyranopterin phosphate synthase [Methanomicrobium sp. W14]